MNTSRIELLLNNLREEVVGVIVIGLLCLRDRDVQCVTKDLRKDLRDLYLYVN